MILIGLGSSLSFNRLKPEDIITKSLEALALFCDVEACSRLYLSPAWPNPADPPFTNAVAAIRTRLPPDALLAALHAVEAGFGRRRFEANAPRTLDLDLLDYDGTVLEGDEAEGLALPHPGLCARDFVLAPLAEVAPAWRHPVSGRTAPALLEGLPNRSARPLAPV